MMRAAAVMAAMVLAGCAGGGTTTTSQPASRPTASSKVEGGSPRDRARAHTELGVSYYEAGRHAIALEELNEALRADQSYSPAWGARALVHMDLREDAQAEKDFKQAMRVDPKDSDSKNNYGMFLCQRNRGQEGVRYLLEAVKNPLYKTPDIAYKNAALCSRAMGDDKSAEEYFARALQLNPNQPQALYNLAEINFARDDLAGAKSLLDRYMSTVDNPGPEPLWLGTRIARRSGDRDGVMRYGDQLRRKYPSSAEAKALMQGRYE